MLAQTRFRASFALWLYADIGYHFIIMADGTLYEGREINIRSTHTESYNASTVGIVLAGNFAINQPTTHKDFNLDLTKDPRDYLYN